MQRSRRQEWSQALDRVMEFETWGDDGLPVIAFPTQGGRFTDYAAFGMVDAIAPWLDAGRLRLYCVDSIDGESWISPSEDKAHRAEMQERYHHYVADDLVELIRDETGWEDRLMVTGNSLGGLHAAISFFRRPDLFGWMLSLSAAFDARHYFGHYMDAILYHNSPVDFLVNMPYDHPWLELYRHSSIIAGIGQGDREWELLPSNHQLDDILRAKGVPAWIDFWGSDMPHDWPTWHRMMPYFLECTLPLQPY